MYIVLIYIFDEAHDTTEIDYNIKCCIYSQSSIVHLSSYYQAYVAQVSGPSSACGEGHRSGLNQRFNNRFEKEGPITKFPRYRIEIEGLNTCLNKKVSIPKVHVWNRRFQCKIQVWTRRVCTKSPRYRSEQEGFNTKSPRFDIHTTPFIIPYSYSVYSTLNKGM